jgi:hypothetical protein
MEEQGVSLSKKMCLALIPLALALSGTLVSQEFRNDVVLNSKSGSFQLDLTQVSSTEHASITLRNSSWVAVSQPQLSIPGKYWAYSAADVLREIPKTGSDEEIAIRAWQYLIDRTVYYCSAGTKNPSVGYITDPIRLLNGHGFGCCEQKAATLGWIWRMLGYQSRLAVFPFHTIPEIFYGGAWHMLDPTHHVFYRNSDGTIASTEDLLADLGMITDQADSHGNDPLGWPAVEMERLYQENASALQYHGANYSDGFLIRMTLRPHEQFTLHSENRTDQLQVTPDQFIPLDVVNSGQFDWDLSFSDSRWNTLPYAVSNVGVVKDSTGVSYLQNTTQDNGSLTYLESTMFPTLGLGIAANVGPGAGTMQAYVSLDGIAWSDPIPFSAANNISSYQLYADLSSVASGFYKYFVKIELSGAIQLHKLRISPVVQVSKFLFPSLVAGSINDLNYLDASAAAQGRTMEITTEIPAGNPQIRGLQATSLVRENATYSIARDYGAANLVDGDPESFAYPASTHFDYQISLNGLHHVTGISIDWGKFGTNPAYINSFSVLARNGAQQPWQTLVKGGYPGQPTSAPAIDCTATDLRIVGDSSNWIGVYEIRVFGTTISPNPIVPVSIVSNVPENPTYSLAQDEGAARLIDGGASTFAYPAALNIDYQMGFASPSNIGWMRVTWGDFGARLGYIDQWSILGRNGTDQPWMTIAQGGFPAASATFIPLNTTVTEIRLLASSQTNWIGVAEVEFGGAAELPITASSHVPEMENQNAINLTDGNILTVAYPGNSILDYTLDPGSDNYIDSAEITWGFWGTNPAFITSWQLLGLPSDSNVWEAISQGGFPNAVSTLVPVQNRYQKIRVQVNSSVGSWIGLADVDLFGTQ